MNQPQPLLEISGLRKHFGPTRALDGADLTIGTGEVHAIIGENGAGKSTLMNILSATIKPDSGEIRFQGKPYHPSGPFEARRAGIAHIHQELSLCPHLSVAENIFLGIEPHHGGLLDRRALQQKTEAILESFHHSAIQPERRVGDLPIAARQIVEICRALAQQASLILMDEPTSSLQRGDIERLFEFIRRLRDSSISVIYISHFLEEVREVCDRFTVLRDGKRVLSGELESTPNEKVLTAMVGREVRDLFPRHGAPDVSDVVLEVQNLHAPGISQVNLELRRGEILGIAGLIGSGRTELVRAIFGLERVESGSVQLAGRPLPFSGGPELRIARGVGYLSEDRQGEGLAGSLSVADNVTLTNFKPFARAGWIDLAEQQRRAEQAAGAGVIHVRARNMSVPVQRLSGGNQQKVAIARLLHQECEIFLLDEPTRGVDVGSKAQIYETIVSLARSGKAVLMVSSYLPELFGICDRLAVMSRGRLSPARPISEWTPETVLNAAIGTT